MPARNVCSATVTACHRLPKPFLTFAAYDKLTTGASQPALRSRPNPPREYLRWRPPFARQRRCLPPSSNLQKENRGARLFILLLRRILSWRRRRHGRAGRVHRRSVLRAKWARRSHLLGSRVGRTHLLVQSVSHVFGRIPDKLKQA